MDVIKLDPNKNILKYSYNNKIPYNKTKSYMSDSCSFSHKHSSVNFTGFAPIKFMKNLYSEVNHLVKSAKTMNELKFSHSIKAHELVENIDIHKLNKLFSQFEKDNPTFLSKETHAELNELIEILPKSEKLNKTFYHGTSVEAKKNIKTNGFKTFHISPRQESSGSYNNETGYGIYLACSPKNAAQYGKKLIKTQINAERIGFIENSSKWLEFLDEKIFSKVKDYCKTKGLSDPEISIVNNLVVTKMLNKNLGYDAILLKPDELTEMSMRLYKGIKGDLRQLVVFDPQNVKV